MAASHRTAARPTPARWVALGLLAVTLVVGLGLARRAIVLSWFAPARDQTFSLAPEARLGPAAARVRVVLIDGLGRADADAVTPLQRVCARGERFVVDTGFPTVSLPVQHVLWTGLTQQQSGVVFSNRRLTPPAFAIPSRVESVAVAESHGEIVRSFGFGQVQAPPDSEHDKVWGAGGFAAAAELALHSDKPLVFVHILRVDEAGHAHGRDSSEYRAAASSAGTLVEDWLPDAVPDDEVWLVLADHGHRDGGGHGGVERSIREVRACIVAGASVQVGAADRVPLVAIPPTLSAWLQTPLAESARGVSLYRYAVEPVPEHDLPRPGSVALLLGLGVLLAGAWVGHRSGHSGWARPWWVLVAFASVWVQHGMPTLSQALVFPPYGSAALLAAAPAGIVVAVSAKVVIARGQSVFSTATALLSAPLALWAAVLVAGGVLAAPWAEAAGPAVMPYLSAHASVLASVLQVGVLGVAVGVAVAHIGRSRG